MTVEETARMYALMQWVSHCAFMRGPVDTKAYFIADEVMAEIKKLVTEGESK